MKTLMIGSVLLSGIVLGAGCETDAQTGALLGAGGGALIGTAIDDNKRERGAMWGSLAGAAIGYVVGNESDKAKERERNPYDY